jgi:hypothetical protein
MKLIGKFDLFYGIRIGMDIREVGWEVVDWMHLAQDRDQ